MAADLVVAVNVGVLLATVHFLHRMSTSVDVTSAPAEAGPHDLPEGVMVYTIQGPFFFAAVESFERALANTNTEPRAVVIRLAEVPFMDVTGIETLEEVVEDFRHQGVEVTFTEANTRVFEKLRRASVIGPGGIADYAPTLEEATERAGSRLEGAIRAA